MHKVFKNKAQRCSNPLTVHNSTRFRCTLKSIFLILGVWWCANILARFKRQGLDSKHYLQVKCKWGHSILGRYQCIQTSSPNICECYSLVMATGIMCINIGNVQSCWESIALAHVWWWNLHGPHLSSSLMTLWLNFTHWSSPCGVQSEVCNKSTAL